MTTPTTSNDLSKNSNFAAVTADPRTVTPPPSNMFGSGAQGDKVTSGMIVSSQVNVGPVKQCGHVATIRVTP